MFFFFHQFTQQSVALWPIAQIGFGIQMPTLTQIQILRTP
jgi:hypothetical protein